MKHALPFLALAILAYLGVVATVLSHGPLELAFALLIAELVFGCLMVAAIVKGN